MKFLFDLLPVILFFAAYKVAGVYDSASLELANHFLGGGIDLKQAPILLATAVAIFATLGQIVWVWARHRRVDTMLWVSLAIVSVFGVDDRFSQSNVHKVETYCALLAFCQCARGLKPVFRPQPDPQDARSAGESAGSGLATAESCMGLLLCRDGIHQPLCRLFVQ